MTSFVERLRIVRKRMQMSQEVFATTAGVSLNSQSNYERSEQVPTAGYFLRLAEMGVDMNYLLARKLPDTREAREAAQLQVVFEQMPPAQRAMAYAMVNLLAQSGSAATDADAAETWRASHLFSQFVNMDQAGKTIVECVAKAAMTPPGS